MTKTELAWIVVALAILEVASLSLCFAYKAKLDSANRYIQFLEGTPAK